MEASRAPSCAPSFLLTSMATPNLFGGKMKRIYTLFVSFVVCAVLCVGLFTGTQAQEDLKSKDGKVNSDKFHRKGKDAIPGKYIVVLEDAAVGERGETSIAGETADLLAKDSRRSGQTSFQKRAQRLCGGYDRSGSDCLEPRPAR
jgi:hypothetical protein